MLKLLFRIGSERYVIDSSSVVEIVPYVPLSPISSAPDYFVGAFNYRGTLIPVIDLCHLMIERYAIKKMSTRIVVVRDLGQDQQMFGFVAEHVTDVLEDLKEGFFDKSYNLARKSFIKGVYDDEEGMIYELDVFDLSDQLSGVLNINDEVKK